MQTRKYALSESVIEIERHNAKSGWDGPVRLYALINTREAIATTPELAQELPPAALKLAEQNPEHLTSVEQEDLPQTQDVEELLATIAWPTTIHGTAIVLERLMLPAALEAELTQDQLQDPKFLANHPDRQEVRLAVGVLRDGTNWCAIRSRDNDSDDQVLLGADLVPGLVSALLSTLID